MKVLLLALGNAPARLHFESIHCENYLNRTEEGHEIITFGYNEDVDIRIRPEDDFSKVIEGLPQGWNPDCCICWEVDWNLLPKNIDRAPFPLVVIPWDWDYDVPLSMAIVKSADITIALADFEKEALRKLGGNAELFYPIGIMDKYMDPAPKKIKDRKYDIFYTSTIDSEGRSDRAKWILKMCSLSGKYNVFFRENLPNFTEYVNTLRDSKLVLSHHRYGSMSGRILEAGAQGAVVLETGTEVIKHFDKDREYIPVTEEDFIEQVEKYLKDEDVLQDISDRVYQRVTLKYEAKKQFLAMLGFLEEKLKSYEGQKSPRGSESLTESQRHIRNGEIYYYSYFRCTSYFLMNTGTKLLELAVEEFRKAVTAERTSRAMTNLAVALISLGFSKNRNSMTYETGKEVVSLLEEVISSDPQYIMAAYNLGLFFYRTARLPEAQKTIDIAVSLLNDPDACLDPWCLHNRDFDLFNILMRKPLNNALMSLCRGEEKSADETIRRLYKAVILYLGAIIKKADGLIFEELYNLRAANQVYPDFDMIVLNEARIASALGFRDEGLKMYERAIHLLPFNIHCRIEHFELLYLYNMDKRLFEAVNETLKIASAIDQLKERVPLIMSSIRSFRITTKELGYSYDPGKEKTLLKFAETVLRSLMKAPRNADLIARIIYIWQELGMTENILVLIEDYEKMWQEQQSIDEKVLTCLNIALGDLKKHCDLRRESQDRTLKRMRLKLQLKSA